MEWIKIKLKQTHLNKTIKELIDMYFKGLTMNSGHQKEYENTLIALCANKKLDPEQYLEYFRSQIVVEDMYYSLITQR